MCVGCNVQVHDRILVSFFDVSFQHRTTLWHIITTNKYSYKLCIWSKSLRCGIQARSSVSNRLEWQCARGSSVGNANGPWYRESAARAQWKCQRWGRRRWKGRKQRGSRRRQGRERQGRHTSKLVIINWLFLCVGVIVEGQINLRHGGRYGHHSNRTPLWAV